MGSCTLVHSRKLFIVLTAACVLIVLILSVGLRGPWRPGTAAASRATSAAHSPVSNGLHGHFLSTAGPSSVVSRGASSSLLSTPANQSGSYMGDKYSHEEELVDILNNRIQKFPKEKRNWKARRDMQALVHNMHTVLYSKMAGRDFIFILYDIGLTSKERRLLPKFVKQLKCYAWKPLVIASLLPKAEYLVWMDASTRWQDQTPLDVIFERVKERGYQTHSSGASIAVRTNQGMATFFGDHLCQYAPFGETSATFGFFFNDRFTHELIIEPWLSCALDQTCMCISNHAKFIHCYSTPPRRYGRCHRFDQSSLGILLTKLYLDHRPMVYLPPGNAINARRGQKMDFFT